MATKKRPTTPIDDPVNYSAGEYNAVTPSLNDGDVVAFQFDNAGNLLVKTVNTGSGSNPAAGATGSAVPADADYQGVNVGGNLTGVTGLSLGSKVAPTVAIVDASGNQITAFGGSGGNAAASATGSAVPSNADYTGFNSGGNLVGVSSSNPLPVTLANTGANSTAVKVDNSGVTQPVSGTVTANAGSGTFTNQQSNVTADYDTGAGTQNLTMFGLALPASGGAVAAPGDNTNGLKVQVTTAPTTTVTGTVTANIGTSGSLALDASVTGLQVAQGSTLSD